MPKKVPKSADSKETTIKDDSLTEEDVVTHHWAVDDIFTFENLGFSKNVDDLKYLICATCEFGPIGFHRLNNKKSFVSLNRITYRKD